jgi:CDP-diglyceride synthetase
MMVRKGTSQSGDSSHKDKSLWPGLILIAIGSYFLLVNFTGFRLDNWWALFILIPAVGSLDKARNEYRAAGHMNKAVRGALSGALITALVAAAFLFNLDWGLIWPLFLIIVAVGALLGTWQDD